MSSPELLLTKYLVIPVAKFLIKRAFGDPAAVVLGGGVDIAEQKLVDRYDAIDQYAKAHGKRSYEARYRQAICRKFDYMELLGADIADESRRHPLSVAFVSLNLHPSGDNGEEEGFSLSFEEIRCCVA